MKTQHTRGPWTLDEVWMIVKGPKGEEVCAIHSGQSDGERVDRNVAHDNARLIAAAPELLEALERLLNTPEPMTTTEHFDYNANATRLARAAIAKAKGTP